MRFSYREYLSIFPGTNDYRLILRPVISIRIIGPKAEGRWDALVDTGADETLFPISLVDVLGVQLDPQLTSEAVGISGERLKIQYGDVEIRVEADRDMFAWETSVGFVDFGSSDDEVIILGHGGCLDFFTATFDGERAELDLVPNALLPSKATERPG